MQLHPDLIGRVSDLTYIALFVDFARQPYAPTRLRTTIATFQDAGFEVTQRFSRSQDGRTYVMLIRDV
jgi:hypothetical protein